MNSRGVIDPRMLTGLGRAHFTATVTIQQSTETRGADGSIVDAWADLANHVSLPCQIVPDSSQGSREIRRQDQTIVKSSHTIHLNAYKSAITEKMRATAGGKTYNILLVLHDSLSKHTDLICEIVE